MKILTDNDLQKIDIHHAAQAIRSFVKDAYRGLTNSPSRTAINLDPDKLVITAGSSQENFGLRAYSYRKDLQRDNEDQVVLCWDRKTHQLHAVAIGEWLGAWRTGLLGGLAYDALVENGTGVCGIIGTGLQAYTQARVIAALAKPSKFLVFSRTSSYHHYHSNY